jgi:hypothetical protein
MEAPTTSANSAVTLIALKRAIMIDALSQPVIDDGDSPPGAQFHPSRATRAQAGGRGWDGPDSATGPVRATAPVTCPTCRMTYLPTAMPAASAPTQDWVCVGCQQILGLDNDKLG